MYSEEVVGSYSAGKVEKYSEEVEGSYSAGEVGTSSGTEQLPGEEPEEETSLRSMTSTRIDALSATDSWNNDHKPIHEYNCFRIRDPWNKI